MKLKFSLSAEGFTKGDRVVVKAGKSEWYVGTIQTSGVKLKIAFDDGATATVDSSDFKDVKHVDPKTKKLKKALTSAEAKALYTAGKPAKTLKAAKAKIKAVKAVKVEAPDKPAGREKQVPSAANMKTAEKEWNKANPGKPFSGLTTRKKNSLAVDEMHHQNYADLANAIMGSKTRSAVKAPPPAPPSAPPAKTSAMAYTKYTSKLTKASAEAKLAALTKRIAAIVAAGNRASRRAQDAGPMDIAYERAEPLEIESDILKWWIANPKKFPPAELMSRFDYLNDREAKDVEYKTQRKEEAATYPSLIGKTIHFKAKGGVNVEAVVLKHLPGKFSAAPRYKAKVPGSTQTWTVPHQMVLKVTESEKHKEAFDAITQKAAKMQALITTLHIGQDVEIDSSRLGKRAAAKIIKVGRTKLGIQMVKDGARYMIPATMLVSIDGKDI